MKKYTLLILITALVLLIVAASFAYHKLSQDMAPQQLATIPPETTAAAETAAPTETTQNTEPPAQTESSTIAAPDFTVYDADGNPVTFSQFVGKPIVLNFWASWCGPCKSEMPDFNEKYEELGGEVTFLMINATDGVRETVEKGNAYVTQQGFTFPVFFDTDYHALSIYGISSFPTTFFIDAEGNLVTYAVGAINAETLQTGIDMIYDA